METKTLYFDESGQTGISLLDADQTYFSVGSTDIGDVDAREILRECFPRRVGTDTKFKDLFRRTSNYNNLVAFARIVGLQPNRFFCFLADKKFALVTRLVDWLVEPCMHRQGYDWYKEDYGRRWVNMFYFALNLPGNEAFLKEVTQLYDRFLTLPSTDTLAEMQRRYRALAESGPDTLRPFMNLVAQGADEFELYHVFKGFRDANDIHVTCVVSSIGWWRAQYEEDFDVIHDESKHFFERQEIWSRVTSTSASEGVIRVSEKCIRFPLRVRSTKPGVSTNVSSLQLCDLIGGFVFNFKARATKRSPAQKECLDKMLDVGIGQIGFDSVTPGYDFVDGPPPIADGPDAVDQITKLIFRQ